MRTIPESANRADWPRLVKETVNALVNAVKGLRTDVAALETATDWTLLADHADDAAAATGGVAVGSLYRTGSIIKVRVS